MGIEKEIQQSSFRNEYHKLLMNLVYTSNCVLEKIKQLMESADITLSNITFYASFAPARNRSLLCR